MKQIIFSLVLSLSVATSFSQDTIPLTKEAYLKKSKGQKTGAWILAGVGAGLLTTAIVTYKPNFNFFGVDDNNDNTLPTISSVFASGAILASILMFESAGKYKRKAATLTFHNQRIPQLQSNNLSIKMQPAIGVQISL